MRIGLLKMKLNCLHVKVASIHRSSMGGFDLDNHSVILPGLGPHRCFERPASLGSPRRGRHDGCTCTGTCVNVVAILPIADSWTRR